MNLGKLNASWPLCSLDSLSRNKGSKIERQTDNQWLEQERSPSGPGRFHPKRWTALTWAAVLLWVWFGFTGNCPPLEMYTVDEVTGELSDPVRFESLAEIPLPIGWPLYYVIPSYLSGPLPAIPVGAAVPPPVPAQVSPLAMITNCVLITLAISSLVYVLQRFRYRFSLLTLFIVTSAFAAYFSLAKLIVLLAGHRSAGWLFTTIYFMPLVIAVFSRYGPAWLGPWMKRTAAVIRRPFLRRRASHHALEHYDNPEDAIAAASRLDAKGEWNASIALYREAAERWPEHAEYIHRCLDQIADKQALAEP